MSTSRTPFALAHPSHVQAQRLWERALMLHRRGVRKVPMALLRVIRARYGADLPLWTQEAEIHLMHNALGVVIHPGTSVAGPLVCFQHVTLGDSWAPGRDGAPSIGRYVLIGAGASVLGPVTIGDHCVIGAGAVVTEDVPSGSIVTGNPGRTRPLDVEALMHSTFRHWTHDGGRGDDT